MARGLSRQTVETVSNVLSQKASPVDIANSLKSANQGDIRNAAVSAANAMQTLGSMLSKVAGSLAPPLLVANVFNDSYNISRDLDSSTGKITDGTAFAALSTVASAAALAATLGAGTVLAPAAAVGLAAAAITASAALGVAALASAQGSSRVHDSVADILNRAQNLARSMGDDLVGFFERQGPNLEAGISLYLSPFTNPIPPFHYGDLFGDGKTPMEPIRNQTDNASTIRSPIILDLDGTGINTVGLSAGVHFDHAGDGFAERTGWMGSGNGLLVWDRNGDGVIDSGRELFGSETVLANGLTAVNGFTALAELDANGDGVIDASDPLFAELRVWVDADIGGFQARVTSVIQTRQAAANEAQWTQAA